MFVNSFIHSFIHFISFHFSSSHLISVHLISFHFISSHLISFHFISSHRISFHFISSHRISFHFISSHFISFHLIAFHSISFHFISFTQNLATVQCIHTSIVPSLPFLSNFQLTFPVHQISSKLGSHKGGFVKLLRSTSKSVASAAIATAKTENAQQAKHLLGLKANRSLLRGNLSVSFHTQTTRSQKKTQHWTLPLQKVCAAKNKQANFDEVLEMFASTKLSNKWVHIR